MHPNFEKILRFAQTTGDKLVVTNLEGEEPVVVMSLTTYAELVGFSSLKQSVKVSHANHREPSPKFHDEIDTLSRMSDESFSVEEPKHAPLRTDRKSLPNQPEKPSEKPIFKAPEDTPLQAEMHISQELAKKQEPEDEVAEEQFYLEPVE